MKILEQPSGYDFEQCLLNRLLRVHVALMHSASMTPSRRWSSTSSDFFDSKTRKRLDYFNWRVRLIRKLGT